MQSSERLTPARAFELRMVRSSFEHSQEKEVLTRTLAFQGVHDVLGSMGYFARRATSIGAALGACSVLQSLSPWRVAFRFRDVAVERSRRVAVWRLALGGSRTRQRFETQLFSCRRNRTRMHAMRRVELGYSRSLPQSQSNAKSVILNPTRPTRTGGPERPERAVESRERDRSAAVRTG